MEKYFAESELIINKDGSIFHLHVTPEHLADKVILVGDPGRVALVASHFDTKECDIESREFHTITGTYKEKRITVISTGIGCDNIDIVMNEIDAMANIDFKTRTLKPELRQLDIVRIGSHPKAHSSAQKYRLASMVCSISMPDATPCVTCPLNAPFSTILAGAATCACRHLMSYMPTRRWWSA